MEEVAAEPAVGAPAEEPPGTDETGAEALTQVSSWASAPSLSHRTDGADTL